MTKLYLIRHSQKQIHAGDPGLTKTGFHQAKETGEYLKQFPINKIISSPLKRTVETAQQIAKELNLEYSLDKALIERMIWNDPKITRQEFIREWIRSTNNREYIPKYGDSSRATGERIHQLVNKVSTNQGHIIFVTHGGAILDYLRNMFGDERLSSIKIAYQEGNDFQMMHCAINKIALNDRPVLKMLNFTEHLTTKSE